MDPAELRRRLLNRYNVVVEPEMERYVASQLVGEGHALRQLPIIGGDARTGEPVRLLIDPARLLQTPQA